MTQFVSLLHTTMKFELIVGHSKSGGIGYKNSIPWKCKDDMKFFRETTIGCGRNCIIMGSNTFKSMGCKPLKDRLNIVLSTTIKEVPGGVLLFSDTMKCVKYLLKTDLQTVFVIGGSSVYTHFLNMGIVSKIYANEIKDRDDLEYDSYFCEIPTEFSMESEEDCGEFIKRVYCNYNREEYQYLDLIKDILDNGSYRDDRTGTGTISVFGRSMRFDLSGGKIPLLTTKRVYWKGVVAELLWFISGCTNSKILEEQGVNIWKGNGSRTFLDANGFTEREEGDLGPVYGFQWRHFGAKYIDCFTDYTDQGVDQLKNCIDLIKNEPMSRRIVVNAWNVADLVNMALPPCHTNFQFFVDGRKLSLQMYQRSVDVALGLPFNLSSYGLLLHMVAHATSMEAGELILCFGDTHIYKNHIEGLQTQILREPLNFPTVEFKGDVKNIDEFKLENIVLKNYCSYDTIKMEMSI